MKPSCLYIGVIYMENALNAEMPGLGWRRVLKHTIFYISWPIDIIAATSHG